MATVTTDETAASIVLPIAPRHSLLPDSWTVADLQEHLGQIPLNRIRLDPPPGFATVDDVEKIRSKTKRICELVDGTLVEKTVGAYESRLAVVLIHLIEQFVESKKLGIVLAPDGTLEILSRLVRAADVAFISWQRLPEDKWPPKSPVPDIVPNLAVEVLSKSNTKAEMKRKLEDYFKAGVELVWYIDPKTRTAIVYTAPEKATQIEQDGSLSGGAVLPGFELTLVELFARADRPV